MAWNSSFPLRFINIAHQYYSPNCTFLFRHMHSQIIFLFISVMFIKIIRNLIPIIAFILLFSWDVAGKPEWTSLGKVSIINFYITSSDGIMFVLVVTMSESFTWIFQHYRGHRMCRRRGSWKLIPVDHRNRSNSLPLKKKLNTNFDVMEKKQKNNSTLFVKSPNI